MNSLAANFDDQLKRGLKVSIALHLLVILAFTVKLYWVPSEPLAYQSALRVDLVALPPKQLETAEPPAPAPAPAAPAAKPERRKTPPKQTEDAVVLNPKKKNQDLTQRQQEALNRLKQMEAMEKLKGISNKAGTSPKDSKLPAPVFAGNQVSKGSDLRGLSKAQHEAYIGEVESHLKRYWALPQWLAGKKNLRAQIQVRIDGQGRVIGKKVVRSSGLSDFDDVALSAIDQAVPFPAPPEHLAGLLANEGILFGFPD